MARLAVVAYVVFALLAFGWRSWVQWRRTGSTGYRGLSGSVGSLEWTGGVLFVVAIVAAAAAPVLHATGMLEPLLDAPRLQLALGAPLYLIGLVGTLWSQLAMGDSWRVGVSEGERTALVTAGPYRTIRNPIFTFMVLAVAGLALLTPNVVALLAVAALVLAVEIQVKAVEEPYLERTHGDAYRSYRAHSWRFVPGVGR